jgi:hypothetical protein
MIQEGNMKTNRIISAVIAVFFIISLCGCSTMAVKEGDNSQPKTAKQLKYEKDEENRSLIVKSISSFAGLVAGGLIGLLTSPKESAVLSSVGGCVIGGGIGFGLGFLIFENTKPGEQKPDEQKLKEQFQDYRNMNLKE